MSPNLQPLMHDSVVLLKAPAQVWCAEDGSMESRPIEGFYHSDTRLISGLELRVGGERPEWISRAAVDASASRFVSLVRNLDDEAADPHVRIDQVRSVEGGVLHEALTLQSGLSVELRSTVTLRLRADASQMQTVKAGLTTDAAAVRIKAAGQVVLIDAGTVSGMVAAGGADLTVGDAGDITATWSVVIPAGGSVTLNWSVAASDSAAVVIGASGPPEWSDARVESDDSRLAAWVATALEDLTALRMELRDVPGEEFLAAGAPWFFTLFGRDSIWAARFMLPLGTKLAASTLRALAALQGTSAVPETAEQPGKIMHEIRASTLSIPGENVTLPPLYFGTVDATALWVNLLHDAWRWGMPPAEVERLLPNLEAALAWMRDYGDSDGDGFLEYVDSTGHGLANQGWKDSGDSIQWRDGRLAEGPIALCEVQAYAYEAAIGGAAMLDHFGRSGGAEWREWARLLKARFAASFWIDDPAGRYPAIALDVHKQRVDTVTSNIGHLLGTGILDDRESRLVADRLVSPELNSGFGLRTMSSDSAGYWPLSYHGGSVWTHDTAIAIAGLSRAGFGAEAGVLISGLLATAAGFDYRMPELHAGDSSRSVSSPVPYPAACRPQAWSAAAAVAVLGAALGLAPADAGDNLSIAPLAGLGAIRVDGLRFRGRSVAVATDAAGLVTQRAPEPAERA